MTSSEQKI